jgi:hypothetical protein
MTAKEKILAEVNASRAAIARDFGSVRREVDVSEKLRRSVKLRPLAWLGGAAALGFFLAGPKTRTKTVVKHVRGEKPVGKAGRGAVREPRSLLGILLALVRLIIPLLRPALSAYAARRLSEFAEKVAK